LLGSFLLTLLGTDESSSLGWGGDLGDLLRPISPASDGAEKKYTYVDGNLSRADAYSETVDDTSDSQHGNVLGSADEDGTNAPDDGADLDGPLSSKDIREVTRDQRSQP
jgi:hypothetical protein